VDKRCGTASIKFLEFFFNESKILVWYALAPKGTPADYGVPPKAKQINDAL
jgi:hypothetical protein